MKRALMEFDIRGIKTTIPFQLEILNHADFVSGHRELAEKTEEDALIAYLQGMGTLIKSRN